MCGIFAYKGAANATQKVFSGLKSLEYRGYDSWGIATAQKSQNLERHIGKIADSKPTLSSSHVAIGHTRWATHGGVTIKNAHPHTDCAKDIFVVHNGIIENHRQLKEKLQKDSHTFTSSTDTEILPHLIEHYHQNSSFLDSVRKAFQDIDGYNAILALKSSTGEILALKIGSPLSIGLAKNQDMYVSSDIPTLLKYTNNIHTLDDNTGIYLKETAGLISAKTGKISAVSTRKVTMNDSTSKLENHEHYLIKEIHEQPSVVRRGVQNLTNIKKMAKIINSAQEVNFIGCGTAAHAGLYAKYLFAQSNNLKLNHYIASEFDLLNKFTQNKSITIACSQSGETIDTLIAAKSAKASGSKILSLVNVPNSSLTQLSDFTLPLHAGVEKSVLATKSYIAMLIHFLLISSQLKDDSKNLAVVLKNISTEINIMLKESSQIKSVARSLSSKEHIFIIGKGINFPTALEGALKIKESSYIHAEALPAGELKHGTIALIEKGTPCIVVASNDETKLDTISSSAELKARGAQIIAVSPFEDDVFDVLIKTKDMGKASQIINTIPFQLLAYYLTIEKGLDPDKPRNLAKSVTVK